METESICLDTTVNWGFSGGKSGGSDLRIYWHIGYVKCVRSSSAEESKNVPEYLKLSQVSFNKMFCNYKAIPFFFSTEILTRWISVY
jgi:hypothetical protein